MSIIESIFDVALNHNANITRYSVSHNTRPETSIGISGSEMPRTTYLIPFRLRIRAIPSPRRDEVIGSGMQT
jgi:hypothetical protein